MATLSRRKLAEHVAGRLLRGDSSKDAMRELAAYLVDTKRTKEAELVIRDIEATLARNGNVVARVVSARTLAADATAAIQQYVKKQTDASHVLLRETIDASVIGGVRIEFPGAINDATIRTKLDKLTA